MSPGDSRTYPSIFVKEDATLINDDKSTKNRRSAGGIPSRPRAAPRLSPPGPPSAPGPPLGGTAAALLRSPGALLRRPLPF